MNKKIKQSKKNLRSESPVIRNIKSETPMINTNNFTSND